MTWLGSAQNGDIGRLPLGSPPAGRFMRGRYNVVWVFTRVPCRCRLTYSSPAQPPCTEVRSSESEGCFPCSFSLGSGLLLLFVSTAAQSTRPSWSLREGQLIVLQMGTQLFYWGTSTPRWATTVITGGAEFGGMTSPI